MIRGADIGVVIAGDGGDAVGRADALEPGAGRGEFRLQRQVDEIAGDRDVIGSLGADVVDEGVQHLAAVVSVAIARPVQIAERPLAREIAQPRFRHRRQMRIRQMRQGECHRLKSGQREPFLYWQAKRPGARINRGVEWRFCR